MATLTAAGLNASDGTLNGQYTGTSSTNTSYPIGQTLSLQNTFGSFGSGFLLNQTVSSVSRLNVSPNAILNTGAYGPITAIAGTWRFRGGTYDFCSNYWQGALLIQRVA